jgi:dTDP-4-dehydrorhamnose reductase
MQKIPTVLIVGTDGQIGSALNIYLNQKKITVFGTTRKKNNIKQRVFHLDLESLHFDAFNQKFDVIVFCASITNIAACETDPILCHKINVINTIKIIDALMTDGGFLIYLSSSSVFSGESQFCKPTDLLSPKTNYGKFKAEVEGYLSTRFGDRSCVLRLTKVITENTPFIELWKSQFHAGKKIRAYRNKFISPVKVADVVKNIYSLILAKQTGVFQLGGGTEISYVEYARKFFNNCQAALDLISEEDDAGSSNGSTYNSLATYLPKSDEP